MINTIDLKDHHLIEHHLLALNKEDRYMRFFSSVNDDSIKNYVSKLKDTDIYFGTFNLGILTSFAHVAFVDNEAEIGLSILENYRGTGLAEQLLKRSIIACSAKNVEKIFMTCLRENKKMQHLCKKVGLKVVVNADEAYSELKLDSNLIDVATDFNLNILSIFDKLT